MHSIVEFRGRYHFLSNFSRHGLRGPDGRAYITAEHAFQAAKTIDPDQRDWIAAAVSPHIAKQRGRRVTLRPDWETARLDVMHDVLLRKFADPTLAGRLRETGNARLVERNRWHDQYWGDCTCGRAQCAQPGLNQLGHLLERVRDALPDYSPELVADPVPGA